MVLIGSSMGGYIATAASEILKPKGLYLLSPAFYLPGYRRTEFKQSEESTRVFHGWQDTVVTHEYSWKICQKYRIRLLMLNSDHRLLNELPFLSLEFERFLTGSG